MMRRSAYAVLALAGVALLVVASAAAAPPQLPPQAKPPTVAFHGRILPSQIPAARPGDLVAGTKPSDAEVGDQQFRRVARVSRADCFSCQSCWSATVSMGFHDFTGGVDEYQYVYWCSVPAYNYITYAQVGFGTQQTGWFLIDSTNGPWWSSGCVGCSEIGATSQMNWHETIPTIGMSSSGTTTLNSFMYAGGNVYATGNNAT